MYGTLAADGSVQWERTDPVNLLMMYPLPPTIVVNVGDPSSDLIMSIRVPAASSVRDRVVPENTEMVPEDTLASSAASRRRNLFLVSRSNGLFRSTNA